MTAKLQRTQFLVSVYHADKLQPLHLATMVAGRVNTIQGVEGNVTCQVVSPLDHVDLMAAQVEVPVSPAQRPAPLRVPAPTPVPQRFHTGGIVPSSAELPQLLRPGEAYIPRDDKPAGPVGDIGFAEFVTIDVWGNNA